MFPQSKSDTQFELLNWVKHNVFQLSKKYSSKYGLTTIYEWATTFQLSRFLILTRWNPAVRLLSLSLGCTAAGSGSSPLSSYTFLHFVLLVNFGVHSKFSLRQFRIQCLTQRRLLPLITTRRHVFEPDFVTKNGNDIYHIITHFNKLQACEVDVEPL